MDDAYRQTTLWRKSLGSNVAPSHTGALARLNTSFEDFRKRASQLTGQIHSALPGLTIHDISHLDALWETGSLLAGEEYLLNPLEGYVLGGAFLLHDSALCFEAYEGGQDAVRNTSAWKDSYELQRERYPASSDEDLNTYADFSALRMLHAHQAEKLGEKTWKNPNGEAFHLINDDTLRTKFGKLIGKIAASHHWSIEKVVRELSSQVNAPSQFPAEWRVDAVKIACLLRCADASHIDDRRAPDFLNALLHRAGVSADHWKAQNWLARIDTDQFDPQGKTAVITSTRAFQQADVKAWWVAYDAISLIEKEIIASNMALSEGHYKISPIPFQIQSISGADDPEKLSRLIEVEGWEPSPTKIYVGNLQRVITNLGGEKLYGPDEQLSVVLRELIQNARDAVVARQITDTDYNGKIRVSTRKSGERTILEISDNGIGMSKRVLTGALLDFGTSFWTSDLVIEEFPGLKAKKFSSIGRFGIGFYSIFMVANSAIVSSRPLNSGVQDVLTLSFDEGLTLRPTLSHGRPEDFTNQTWSRVTIHLKDEHSQVDFITYKLNVMPRTEFPVPFATYLRNLVCGLDVTVEYKGDDSEAFEILHSPVSKFPRYGGRKTWLSNIMLIDEFNVDGSNTRKPLLDFYEKNLRPFIVEGNYKGLATISLEPQNSAFLNISTVGGLATSVQNRSGNGYVGWMDYEPASAKRDADSNMWKGNPAFHTWLDDQKKILETLKLNAVQLCIATSNIANLGGDVIDFFHVLISTNGGVLLQNLDELFSIARTTGFACFKSSIMDHVETHHTLSQYLTYPTFRPIANGNLLSLKWEHGSAEDQNSILGCLERFAASKGMKISVNEFKNVGDSLVGPLHAVVIRAV